MCSGQPKIELELRHSKGRRYLRQDQLLQLQPFLGKLVHCLLLQKTTMRSTRPWDAEGGLVLGSCLTSCTYLSYPKAYLYAYLQAAGLSPPCTLPFIPAIYFSAAVLLGAPLIFRLDFEPKRVALLENPKWSWISEDSRPSILISKFIVK